jgi:hypothetical protein
MIYNFETHHDDFEAKKYTEEVGHEELFSGSESSALVHMQ